MLQNLFALLIAQKLTKLLSLLFSLKILIQWISSWTLKQILISNTWSYLDIQLHATL